LKSGVVLTGDDLTIEDVVRVARGGTRVTIAKAALARMRRARLVVERILARGEAVYGVTTGVGSRKRVGVATPNIEHFNRLLVRNHRVGQGALAPDDVVRAAMVRIANGFARGTSAARPELATLVVRALNRRARPRVRMLGSVGQADIAQNADLAHAILGPYRLAAGEALAFLNNSAFSTGAAALAVADAERLLSTMEMTGALSFEAFGGNVDSLHPAIDAARPFPGVRTARAHLAALLEGSFVADAARNLQDPLTFRGMPQLFGAARDAMTFVKTQLSIELNSSQENPFVVPKDGRVISAWNGEVASLAAALDFLRIALAPVLTSANERLLKLLHAPLSGLPDGLAARPGLEEDGLAELGVASQSIAAEARLLAQPVSFELVSTTQAEGIEDRMSMAPLAARRLSEMVDLGERLAAIELVVAAQAVDLRASAWPRSPRVGRPRLGRGTSIAYRRVRARIPFVDEGDAVPSDLESVRDLVKGGLAALTRSRERS
jgi:histidine ammonia-lyase